MKSIISKGCLFVVLITLLVSCGSRKPVVVQNETINTKTITETVKDTIFVIEKDSSSYRALLDCLDGKVVVKNVTQAEPGRNLKSPKVRIENNQLEVDCEARAQELLVQWKEKNQNNETIKTIEVPVVTNVLTWFQQTQIYGCWLFGSIVMLALIWLLVKAKFKS
jgi:hypothetical protein